MKRAFIGLETVEGYSQRAVRMRKVIYLASPTGFERVLPP